MQVIFKKTSAKLENLRNVLVWPKLIEKSFECNGLGKNVILKSKTYEDILEVLSKGWLRYFGPPKIFLADEDGALVGEDSGRLCDKYGIEKWLAGSDPQHLDEVASTLPPA